MASILSFVRAHDGVFDDETTRIMGEAFDAACAVLPGLRKNDREAIAVRIIDAAAGGELDPTRLRNAGLGALRPR